MSKYVSACVGLARDVLSGAFFRDYMRGEPSIELRPACLAEGIEGWLAPGLVAQGTDTQGCHLATRGFHLYRLDAELRTFQWACRLPCPWSAGQLLHSPSLRNALSKRDVVQILSLQSGALMVHSCGTLYRRPAENKSFQAVMRLRYFGAKSGRGVLFKGLTQSRAGRVFLGEYFHNPQRVPVRIYCSDDDGRSWRVLYEFPAGEIRHVHAIQEDPYTGQIWVCAGDTDQESRILCSDDGGESFVVVGQGSQSWRCCSLIFGPAAVYWAVDTERNVDHRYLMRYRRTDQQVDKVAPLDGAVELGVQLDSALHVYTTIRMGYGPVPDDQPSIWLSDGDVRAARIPFGARINQAKGAEGKIKVYHSAAHRLTCFSFSNVAGLDGQLALIPADSLSHWFIHNASSIPSGPIGSERVRILGIERSTCLRSSTSQ